MLSWFQASANPHGWIRHQRQQRAGGFRHPVHGHVDERLDFLPQLGRQRQEQHLAGRLVDRIPERLVGDPRQRRGPERVVQQDDRRGDRQIRREDQQREPDAEIAVDARRDPDLDDEGRGRRVEADLRQERADRILLSRALEDLGRHVDLLIEQGRAEGAEADDHRDDLDLAGAAQQLHRPRHGHAPFFLVGAG